MKVMILSFYILGAQWWFVIFNSKLRSEINFRKLFTQGISSNMCSKESHIENSESDTLTTPGLFQFGNTLTERGNK